MTYRESVLEHGKKYWTALAAKHDGVISRMAGEAGLDRVAVRNHLKKHGLYVRRTQIANANRTRSLGVECRVRDAVAGGVKTVGGIAAKTKLPRTTVVRHLRRLREKGELMVFRGGRGNAIHVIPALTHGR